MKNEVTESHLALLKSIDEYFDDPSSATYTKYKKVLKDAIQAEEKQVVPAASAKLKRENEYRLKYYLLVAVLLPLLVSILFVVSEYNQLGMIEPQYEIANAPNTEFYHIDETAYLEFTATAGRGSVTHTISWRRPDGSTGSQSVTIETIEGRHAYPLGIPYYPCTTYQYYSLIFTTSGSCGGYNNNSGQINNSGQQSQVTQQPPTPTPIPIPLQPSSTEACNVTGAIPTVTIHTNANENSASIIQIRYAENLNNYRYEVIGFDTIYNENDDKTYTWYHINIRRDSSLQGWVREDTVFVGGINCPDVWSQNEADR